MCWQLTDVPVSNKLLLLWGGPIFGCSAVALVISSHKHPHTLQPTVMLQHCVTHARTRSQVLSIMEVLPALNLFLKAAFNGYQYGEGCEPKCIGGWARHTPSVSHWACV